MVIMQGRSRLEFISQHLINMGEQLRNLNMHSINIPPTLNGVGHQTTMSTNTDCNQWLSLAKPTLKVHPPLVGIVHWWPAPVSMGGL